MRVALELFAWIASAMCVVGCGSHTPADTGLDCVEEGRALVKFNVNPTVETAPVPHDGDAADDPAIWIHPSDPAQSTIIGTDKRGGLVVYDLLGTHLAAQVGGLTLYYTSDRKGYLIASSQASNQFTVYRHEGKNAYVTTFEITAGNTADGVTHTDGIDVTNFPLGPRIPAGVFVAQDHRNTDPSGAQNNKLIPWEAIATGASPPLMIDTMRDPRRVGETR